MSVAKGDSLLYGYSFLLAWVTFLFSLAASITFLAASRKRKLLDNDNVNFTHQKLDISIPQNWSASGNSSSHFRQPSIVQSSLHQTHQTGQRKLSKLLQEYISRKTFRIKVMTRVVIRTFAFPCIWYEKPRRKLKFTFSLDSFSISWAGWSREFEESVPNLNLLCPLCDHYSLVVITCPWHLAVNWINKEFSLPPPL